MDMMTYELIEHELIQGTPEWLDFRMNHDGASEAAAMLGISKKTSRNELLRMKSSGITKEFSDWVQKNILDYGHEVEAMARPIVEKQLGTKLYPVTCSRGRMSASCDGKNMAGVIGWEHKQWNKELAASVASGVLPDEHWPQVQQELLVTGAEKWIFTVSDGTEENMVSMEVLPDPEKFETLRAGWAQFNKDRENYVHVEVIEMPKAEVTIDLPALFVHAKGMITEHNMEAFGTALTAKLAEVRAITLVTDQDFSNAKAAASKFRETAKAIALSKAQMLAQTETIGEAALKMDAWAKDLNATALQLEKDVTKEDLKKKEAMINAAALAFSAHVEILEAETRPIRLNAQKPDFAGSIKGKSKYSSMQDAIDAALANGIISADAIAKDVRAKLAWCKEHAAGMSALFPDLQALMAKPLEDFTLVIQTRIDKQKADEAARLEAERARIQAEEEAKARAKIEAETKAKEESEARAKAHAESAQREADAIEERRKDVQLAGQEKPVAVDQCVRNATMTAAVSQAHDQFKQPMPSPVEIIRAVADCYKVSMEESVRWINIHFNNTLRDANGNRSIFDDVDE
ncbi:MAG: YqaJ viral recombinase family protein [Gallionellaceae bacterium]|jgi:predicted phage-related endonuclease